MVQQLGARVGFSAHFLSTRHAPGAQSLCAGRTVHTKEWNKKLFRRKKSVIVLKNGKNIFPEEMENLVNKIEGVKESFIFGKQQSEDKNDIKINVKIVFDRDIVRDVYKVQTDSEIQEVLSKKIKEINQTMPKYKSIKGILLTEEPLIKTTTNKIKRQENLKKINNSYWN